MAPSSDQRLWTQELLRSPHDAPDKAQRVRGMFNAIAPRYELVNRVFSGGRDAAWRRRAVALARISRDDEVLDIACGTGDFARAFADADPGLVTGCDFAHDMLREAVLGHRRADASPAGQALTWCEADALRLPFCDASFSVVSCAFGVRNFQSLDTGLAEMHRVLRRGGRAVILEFTQPRNRFIRAAYEVYATRIMPRAATWLSGDRSGAYEYLPRSVVEFLSAEAMRKRLMQNGFARVAVTPMTLGVVTIYVASRD